MSNNMPYMYDEAVEAFNLEGLATDRARWEYRCVRVLIQSTCVCVGVWRA